MATFILATGTGCQWTIRVLTFVLSIVSNLSSYMYPVKFHYYYYYYFDGVFGMAIGMIAVSDISEFWKFCVLKAFNWYKFHNIILLTNHAHTSVTFTYNASIVNLC